MSVPSGITPEDWIREQLERSDGPLHPGELLMPEKQPEHFDSVSLQFGFWRLLSAGEIKLNRNRSVSLANRDAERSSNELPPS